MANLNICFKGALVVMGLLIRSLMEASLVGELVGRLKEEFNAGGGEAFTRAIHWLLFFLPWSSTLSSSLFKSECLSLLSMPGIWMMALSRARWVN